MVDVDHRRQYNKSLVNFDNNVSLFAYPPNVPIKPGECFTCLPSSSALVYLKDQSTEMLPYNHTLGISTRSVQVVAPRIASNNKAACRNAARLDKGSDETESDTC